MSRVEKKYVSGEYCMLPTSFNFFGYCTLSGFSLAGCNSLLQYKTELVQTCKQSSLSKYYIVSQCTHTHNCCTLTVNNSIFKNWTYKHSSVSYDLLKPKEQYWNLFIYEQCTLKFMNNLLISRDYMQLVIVVQAFTIWNQKKEQNVHGRGRRDRCRWVGNIVLEELLPNKLQFCSFVTGTSGYQ